MASQPPEPTDHFSCHSLQKDSPFCRLPTELILQVMSSLKTRELGMFIVGARRPLATRGILGYRSLEKIRRLLARPTGNQNALAPLSRLPPELQDQITFYLSTQERVDLFIAIAG